MSCPSLSGPAILFVDVVLPCICHLCFSFIVRFQSISRNCLVFYRHHHPPATLCKGDLVHAARSRYAVEHLSV